MILSRAPLRIPLGGGGTDLPSYYSKFGGFVLSAAINKYVYICLNRPSADDLIRAKYSRYEQVSSPDEVQHDLLRPALKQVHVDSNIEITSMADVPSGTGLGSSGTYLVALLTALHSLKRETMPSHEIAEQACHIEIDLAGHPVGKHDQYMATFGGITCLEFKQDGQVEVAPMNIPVSALEDLSANVLLFYTGMNRPSSEILGQQCAHCENGDSKVLDSLHRTKELGYRIKEALAEGDLEKFGCLLDEHWQNKKKRSSKISDGRIDHWYQIARENGALGGKIMGAGGGGFFMFFCPNNHKSRLREALTTAGLREMKYDFDFEGAKVLVNL
jgi:D-glycero-alpha-D-manno-heptose-7-phosphate kinase